MDREFEILPSAVDMRLRVWGKTLQELFCNALCAMASCLKPEALASAARGKRVTHTIAIEAVDISSLLVEFLSEAITQTYIQNAVFTGAAFTEFGENFLKGRLAGVAVGELEKEIKAVSYHEVDIKKNPDTGSFETVLVFDI